MREYPYQELDRYESYKLSNDENEILYGHFMPQTDKILKLYKDDNLFLSKAVNFRDKTDYIELYNLGDLVRISFYTFKDEQKDCIGYIEFYTNPFADDSKNTLEQIALEYDMLERDYFDLINNLDHEKIANTAERVVLIKDIQVDKEYRNQGVGFALLELMEKETHEFKKNIDNDCAYIGVIEGEGSLAIPKLLQKSLKHHNIRYFSGETMNCFELTPKARDN